MALFWAFFFGFLFFFVWRFLWPLLVVFRGRLTSLDPECHRDDIVLCSGWLITTADTCTQCECLPESGTSPLHLTQLTEHCGLNRVMQDGFFRNFAEAILSSSVFVLFGLSLWRLLPVWWLSFGACFRGFFFGFPFVFGGFCGPSCWFVGTLDFLGSSMSSG